MNGIWNELTAVMMKIGSIISCKKELDKYMMVKNLEGSQERLSKELPLVESWHDDKCNYSMIPIDLFLVHTVFIEFC